MRIANKRQKLQVWRNLLQKRRLNLYRVSPSFSPEWIRVNKKRKKPSKHALPAPIMTRLTGGIAKHQSSRQIRRTMQNYRVRHQSVRNLSLRYATLSA